MSYKDKDGKFHGAEILDKLKVDEPFFVLRGGDQFAEQLTRAWCGVAEAAGVKAEKVNKVRQIANAMQDWKETKGTKLPD